MSFDIPIALFVFNRPKLTAAVFDSIRRLEPERLLLIADGPRAANPNDFHLVQETRRITSQVNWDCDVETCLSDENLGCRLRMASGLDWAFSRADKLIVLEDDCLPGDSFFAFCRSLLNRFENDPRVAMISGDNFQPGPVSADSYYFSRWAHIWGWASWRRAWQNFDLSISKWPEIRRDGALLDMVDSREEAEHWTTVFDDVHLGQIDTWDFSWMFSCWLHGGLTVIPQLNLVTNLGFGPDATHTLNSESPLACMSSHHLKLDRHPAHFVRNRRADEYTFRNLFAPSAAAKSNSRTRPNWLRRLRPFRKIA